MNLNISIRKILGNSTWIISEKILTMLFSIIVTAFIARYLGTEQYGFVNYIISIVLIFTAFSTLGMEKLIIKDIVDEKYSKEVVLGTAYIIRVVGGIFLIIISQIFIYFLEPNNIMAQIVGILVGTSIFFKAFEIIEYYFQAKMKMKVVSIIRFITTIIVSIFKMMVIIFDFGIIGFAASYTIDTLIAGILFYIAYKTKNKKNWEYNKTYSVDILKKCWYIAIAGLMTTIYMRIDQIMLGTLLDDKSENGIYSAAIRISEMWYFIPTAIIASFQPSIINKKNESEDEYNKLLQQMYDIISLISIVFCIFISLFGCIAIKILYGSEYLNASGVLTISVWSGIFASLGSARGIWLIIENLQKYTLIYTIVGVLINIMLNLILIPNYGAYGAAIATLITQFISNIVILLFFKSTRKSSIMMVKSIVKNTIIKNIINKRKLGGCKFG